QISAADLNETRAQNVVQQLEGKVSGVQISSPGTQGGSTNIIIRGQNSITGNNQPLFIVDGVAVSNADRGGAPFVGSNTNFDYGQGSGGEFEWVDGNYGGVNDGTDESWGPKLDGRLICQFDSPGAGTANCQPTPWVAHPDNVKNFFRTGVTGTTTVGVSGGTDRVAGRLSFGGDNVTGIFPNNNFQR